MRTVVAAALTCLVAATASCRAIKETEYVTLTEYVHDTTEIEVYVHDTTRVVKVVHDSVDRYVEKTKYIDKDGVVHEKEIERLTKYIKESHEEYEAKETEYKRRIAELESALKEKSSAKEVVVEKKTATWQKMLMFLGGLLLIGILAFLVGIASKTRRN